MVEDMNGNFGRQQQPDVDKIADEVDPLKPSELMGTDEDEDEETEADATPEELV